MAPPVTYRFVDEEPVSYRFVDEPSEPSFLDQAKKYAPPMSLLLPGGPLMKGAELLDKAAYTAGGKVTDALAGKVPPEVAGGAGYLTNVGIQAAPTLLAGEAAKVMSPAFKGAGRWLMGSATKPTLEQLQSGKAARAINTMLEQGFTPTKGGVEAMRLKIADLNDEISKAIANSPATVDKGKVASYLQDAVKKFEAQVNPSSDLKAIESAWTDFLNHPLLSGAKDIPVQLAQKLKQGTYKVLGEKAYGELKGASEEAQKTLARGLREEISKAVPVVAGKNALERELINAANIAERRALVDSNKNPLGLAPLAKNPGAAAAFLADRSAWVKAMLARLLYSGSEQIPANAARLGAGYAGALSNQPEEYRGILSP